MRRIFSWCFVILVPAMLLGEPLFAQKKAGDKDKDLDALRGPDKKLPGFMAEFSDVQQDQLIQVSLVRKKDAPKVVVKPKKGKDKDADLDPLADNLPQVSMIVILREPPPGK